MSATYRSPQHNAEALARLLAAPSTPPSPTTTTNTPPLTTSEASRLNAEFLAQLPSLLAELNAPATRNAASMRLMTLARDWVRRCFAFLTPQARLHFLTNLDRDLLENLLHDWVLFRARDNQLPAHDDWSIWLLMAGRGFGKTRAGAEWVRFMVESGQAKHIALVGRTIDDARRVMVEGPSGLLAIAAPNFAPTFEPSKNRLVWPNGAVATLYSAAQPKQLRGPQHDAAWCDELAAWDTTDAFDQLRFGLRLGERPRLVITTTPRPIPLLKALMEDPSTLLTVGSTFDNAANLSEMALSELRRKYANTRLGRQELYAELLTEVDGALFTRDLLEEHRIQPDALPQMKQIVVAIDPAATSGSSTTRAGHSDASSMFGGQSSTSSPMFGGGREGAETGIIVAGKGIDGHAYILADVSLRGSPDQWARRAISAYEIWQADHIIAESNTGGEMIKHTLHTIDRRVPIKTVHATRGKLTRATPIAALYEQGRVHHAGYFPKLEEQYCTWLPGAPSPDRLDAAIWALSQLMLTPEVPKLTIQPNPFYP